MNIAVKTQRQKQFRGLLAVSVIVTFIILSSFTFNWAQPKTVYVLLYNVGTDNEWIHTILNVNLGHSLNG